MDVTTPSTCPSHFALDDRELHAGAAAFERHIEQCPRCAARLAQRSADGAAFAAASAPLWTRIAARGRERRHQRRLWTRLTAVLAGVGAVALVAVRLSGSAAPYIAPKGRAPIEITCRRDGAISVLAPGDEVAPGDELRFRPLPGWPSARFIQIGSVDGGGRYIPFYPSQAGGASVGLPAAGEALAGSIRLDTAPGPERLFVVLSAASLSADAVRRVAEPRAAAGTTVDRIDGVPVTASWIVFPKRAGAARTP